MSVGAASLLGESEQAWETEMCSTNKGPAPAPEVKFSPLFLPLALNPYPTILAQLTARLTRTLATGSADRVSSPGVSGRDALRDTEQKQPGRSGRSAPRGETLGLSGQLGGHCCPPEKSDLPSE